MFARFYRSMNAGFRRMMPDPVEVISHDLGLPVDATTLARAQAAWCAKWNRDSIGEFCVHDAVHYFLDAPPTPAGEGAVLTFQVRHGIYDTNVAPTWPGRSRSRSAPSCFAERQRSSGDF